MTAQLNIASTFTDVIIILWHSYNTCVLNNDGIFCKNHRFFTFKNGVFAYEVVRDWHGEQCFLLNLI